MTTTYYPHQIVLIQEVAERDREGARNLYRQVFGVAVASKKIDKAIQRHVDEVIDGLQEAIEEYDTDYLVAIPFRLLLAITLRKHFARGRGRPHRPSQATRNLWLAIRLARKRKAEYIRQSIRRGQATERAVSDAASRYGIPASIIRDEMGRKRWDNSLDYLLRN
jgi:hypothetical protein